MATSINSPICLQKAPLKKRAPFFASVLAASAVLFSACTAQRASSDSQIIREVEAAGSGPVENLSVQSLTTWFQQHTHLANQINKQCDQVKKTAAASWGDTPEGHVCEAASETAMWHYEP